MVKQQLFIGAALVVGVAAGYFVPHAGETSSEAPAETEEYVPEKAIDDKGDEASIRALKSRIAQLEEELAKKDVERSEERVEERENRPMRGGNPREWMENLKKENPERYAQMTNGMARFREQRTARQQAKLDFLSSVDTSKMSAEAQRTHGELQSLIAKRHDLEGAIMDENLSDEKRGELMREIFENSRQIRELSREERNNLLEETGKALGLEGEAAKELTDTIREIYEATDDNVFGGRGGPMGRGGRGRGPGGRGRR